MEEKEAKQEALIPSAIGTTDIAEIESERRVDWKDLLKYLEVQKEAFKKYRIIAIGYTRDKDWVIIDGTPYLQESGSQAIAGPMGVSIGEPKFVKEWAEDGKGKYYIYTCTAEMKSRTFNKSMGAVGICTSRDKFFAVKGGELKDIEDVDERNIKMKAYTNMSNNGIKRILGMRNIEISELVRAGINVDKVEKVDHKLGGKKTEASAKAVTQAKKEAEEAPTNQPGYTPQQIDTAGNITERIINASSIEELKEVWERTAEHRKSLPEKLFKEIAVEKDKRKEWLQRQPKENNF